MSYIPVLEAAATLTSGGHPSSHEPGRHCEDDVNLLVTGPLRSHPRPGSATPGNLALSPTLTASMGQDAGHPGQGGKDEIILAVAHALTAEGADASEDGTGRGTPLVLAFTLHPNDEPGGVSAREAEVAATLTGNPSQMEGGDRGTRTVYRKAQKAHSSDDAERWEETAATPTLDATGMGGLSSTLVAETVGPLVAGRGPGGHGGSGLTGSGPVEEGYVVAQPLRGRPYSDSGGSEGGLLAFGISSDAVDRSGEGDGTPGGRSGLGIVPGASPSLRSRPTNSVAAGMAVRRLTPLECERLQGFPDGWTEGQADSARYRELGNAVAVPVVEWVGTRLTAVDRSIQEHPGAVAP
jgi:DNA (cytosine-5)-methyltransferase 1